MKTLKYILLAIVALAGFTACSDDATETPSGINGYGVYFSVNAPSKIEIAQGQNVVYVPVMRSTNAGALSTRVLFTPEEESMDIFTVNPNIEFADGESTAEVEISFNFRDLDISVPYAMTLSLADGNHSTAYGAAQYTFSIIYDPWVLIDEPAVWRDDVLDGLFGLGIHETEVTIYESPITKGLYRLENVYSPEFVGAMVGASPAAVAGNCREAYITINASNPDKVWIAESEMGFMIDGAYGWMSVASFCQENGFNTNEYGTLKDLIITFPEKSFGVYMPNYNGGGWYYGNMSGKTRLVLPGGNPLDPMVDASFEGFFTDIEGETTAIFDAELNDDASSFRWALVNENIEGDTDAIEAVKSGIVDGSIESEIVAQNGRFTVAVEEAGEYTVVLVPFSADGKTAGTATAVTFEFVTGGSSASEFTAEITVTDIDETWATVSIQPNAANLLYYWDYMPTESYNQILADPQINSIGDYYQAYFEYMVDQYAQLGANISIPELVQAVANKGAVEELEIDGLTPGTEYTVVAYCINKSTAAPRSAASVATFKTSEMAPMDPDYEAWLGTWTVTSTKTESTDTPQTFDIEFAPMKSNAGFSMTGWGLSPVNDTKLTVIWQKNEETGAAMIGIPEQLTKATENTDYGVGTVAFFARGKFNGQYGCWGGGDIALYGMLTDSSNGQFVCGEGETQSGQTVAFTGADYFVDLNDGSGGLLSYLRDFAVGPYKLVKKAGAATASKSAKNFGKFVASGRNARIRSNITPRVERAMFLKRLNLVEIR